MSSEPISKAVKDWFATANEDLRGARSLHNMSPEKYLRLVPYLCQQAAEKAIKGLLTYKKIKFTKTHDIGKLSVLVLPHFPELETLLKSADKLTKYALHFRYPDAVDFDAPVLEDSIEALKLARKVYDEAASRIPFSGQWNL